MKRPLAAIGLTYMATSAFAVCFFPEINFILSIMAAITAIAACFIYREKSRDIILIVCPVCIAFLIIGCCQTNAGRLSDRLGEKSCVISGEICEIPRCQYGRWYYIIRTDRVDIHDVKQSIRIVMTSRKALEEAKEGDRITCEVHFVQSSGETGYNSTTSLRADGIDARCWCKTYSSHKVTRNNFKFRYIPQRIKRAVISRIRKALPKRAAAMLCGMLLGDTGYMDSATVDNFRSTGISHLLAVSGFHLTLLTLALQAVLRKLKTNYYIYLCIVIFFILSFMAVTGFSPSVARAATMHILALLSGIFLRNSDSVTSLSFAVLLMCIVNPWAAADIGLQLSVCSTLGLILFHPRFNKAILESTKKLLLYVNKMPESSRIRRFGKNVLRSISVSLSAVFATLPLTSIHFDSVSIISPVTNLLCIYISSVFIILGILASFIYTIPVVGWIISLPLRFFAAVLCGYLESVTQILAELPFSTVNTGFSYTPYIFLFITLLIGGAFIMYRRVDCEKLGRRLRRVVLCGIAVMLFSAMLSHQVFCRGAEIIVFDVGDGGMCVCAKDRTHAVFAETGGDSYGMSVIKQTLQSKGVEKIDAISVSDENEARSGNLRNMLEQYQPRFILTDIDSFTVRKFKNTAKTEISPYESRIVNDSLALQTEAFTDTEGKKWRKITCGDTTALICPEKGNCVLLPEDWRSCDAVITGDDILGISTLNYGAVIITAKEKKADSLQNRLQGIGIKHVYSTSVNGNIVLTVKNDKLLVRTQKRS